MNIVGKYFDCGFLHIIVLLFEKMCSNVPNAEQMFSMFSGENGATMKLIQRETDSFGPWINCN